MKCRLVSCNVVIRVIVGEMGKVGFRERCRHRWSIVAVQGRGQSLGNAPGSDYGRSTSSQVSTIGALALIVRIGVERNVVVGRGVVPYILSQAGGKAKTLPGANRGECNGLVELSGILFKGSGDEVAKLIRPLQRQVLMPAGVDAPDPTTKPAIWQSFDEGLELPKVH